MSECMILRVHRYDIEDRKWAKEIADQLSNVCKVYVQLNIPDNTPIYQALTDAWNYYCQENNMELITFREDIIKKTHPEYLGAWRHSQLSFICGYESLNEINRIYDYYWYMEYDARYGGDISDMILFYRKYKEDLLGTHLGHYSQSPGWLRWYDQPKYMTLSLEKGWKYFGCLSRLSRRLLEGLAKEVHENHTHQMVEVYVPTICADLFGPDSMRDFDKIHWNESTVQYRPIWGTPQEWDDILKYSDIYKNKLTHPIKTGN